MQVNRYQAAVGAALIPLNFLFQFIDSFVISSYSFNANDIT